MSVKTITDVVRMPIEEIVDLPLEEQKELLSIVEKSNAKNGEKKAKLIRDIVETNEKKEKREAKKEPVENSTKTKAPKKEKSKKPAPKKPKESKKEKGKKQDPKKSAPKKPKLKKPNLKDLPEEARQYIEQLEEKAIVFPEKIEGDQNTYIMQEVSDQKELKNLILSEPYKVYLFVDEFQEEPTQTLALLSNSSVTVLFDQTRHSNTTINLLNKNVDFDSMTIKPENKHEGDRDYDFAVYLREPNK